jgi:peptidoglycan/LPS O-acetylase OafA/YrhL
MAKATSEVGDRRLDSLDGIRALAIGAVFLLHMSRAYFPGGAFGVDVFFVLSAYLITGILLRELDQRGHVNFRAFYWRRFFRLAPALVVWLALVAAPTAFASHQSAKIPWSTAGALFYFNDFLEAWTHLVGTAYDQSWSLSVEEQFYFVWPFLLALLVTRIPFSGQRRAMVGLVAASTVIWYFVGNYFLPTGHLPALALGALAAFWSVQGGTSGRLAPIFGDTRVAIGCLGVFVAALFIEQTRIIDLTVAIVVDVAATVLILHCTLSTGSIVSRLLESPISRWIGVRSYGIYLYGLTLLLLIPSITHLSLHYAAPLAVVATALVAAVSYRFVEAPFRYRGRLWLSQRELQVRRQPGDGTEDPAPVERSDEAR